jgi:hypothetical protein
MVGFQDPLNPRDRSVELFVASFASLFVEKSQEKEIDPQIAEIGERFERIVRPLEQHRQPSEEGTDNSETPPRTSPVEIATAAPLRPPPERSGTPRSGLRLPRAASATLPQNETPDAERMLRRMGAAHRQ